MLNTLIEIAREAGKLALEIKKSSLDVSTKGSNVWNIVTQADIEVEKFIRKKLTAKYPDIQILGEEQDKHLIPSGNFVTIDPIDGTIAFAHGYNNWGVILGDIVNGQPERGVIFLPEHDILVATEKGNGCTINGKPITINCAQTLAESVVGVDLGPWVSDEPWDVMTRLRLKCQWLGGSGMAAASITDVLLGRSAAYTNFFAKIWDFSAGALAITEAGGIVTQPNGQPLRWDQIQMQAIFSANENIAKEIQAIIS